MGLGFLASYVNLSIRTIKNKSSRKLTADSFKLDSTELIQVIDAISNVGSSKRPRARSHLRLVGPAPPTPPSLLSLPARTYVETPPYLEPM